jgi:DEAD/DEAH box helicase domain-containing protein
MVSHPPSHKATDGHGAGYIICNMKFEIIFDCETKKFFDEISDFDPAKLGVSIVSTYSRTLDEDLKEIEGKMESFWEADFPKLWELFRKADRIIGFNSIGFDVPALAPYSPIPLDKLKHFDILTMIKDAHGKRMSLDSLAKATLGTKKNDNGINAIKYWNAGDATSLAKLQKYCEMDVALTRDLYDHVLKNGFLKYTDFWNEPHEVKLDFGYPKTEDASVQDSLF